MRLMDINICVYDKASEWEQGKYFVSVYDDVFWTDSLDEIFKTIESKLKEFSGKVEGFEV